MGFAKNFKGMVEQAATAGVAFLPEGGREMSDGFGLTVGMSLTQAGKGLAAEIHCIPAHAGKECRPAPAGFNAGQRKLKQVVQGVIATLGDLL